MKSQPIRRGRSRGKQLRTGADESHRESRQARIAAVNGFALGGGCERRIACTIRVAAENAKFGQPEVKLGSCLAAAGRSACRGSSERAGPFSSFSPAEMISAAEAYRIGLVNEVVRRGGLIARAEAILKQIFANAPICPSVRARGREQGVETSLSEGLLLEASFVGLCAATEDKKEGTSAFLEKRAAKFRAE